MQRLSYEFNEVAFAVAEYASSASVQLHGNSESNMSES